jgi:hypothetical protein
MENAMDLLYSVVWHKHDSGSSLHTCIYPSGELGDDFLLALQAYVMFRYSVERLVEMITNETTRGLTRITYVPQKATYPYLFLLADALGHFRFLKTLVDNRNILNEAKQMADTLKHGKSLST